jgi:hypothetical protein
MEQGVSPSGGDNPLNKACGIGIRKRGIGTGEIVAGVKSTQNSVGYVFFSYANINPISNSPNWGYVKLDGVDPINGTYTTGNLPPCVEPCALPGGTSFPHLRDGTYRSWSVLRVVTDAGGTNNTNVKNLVNAAQAHVNSTDPDFVPFLAQGPGSGEPGLQKYRSHFQQIVGGAPSNGLPNGVGTEHGGDMGGAIEPNGPPPGVLGVRQ